MTATPETTVHRYRARQDPDAAARDRVLAEGLVAHVGFVRDGWPVVLPFAYAVGDLGDGGRCLLLHGSTAGGVFSDTRDGGTGGVAVSVAVTLLDGLVFARSLFDSSMDYRSVVVFGHATVVAPELRIRALEQIGEHLMPGRGEEVRAITGREAAATTVLRVPLDRWSLKVRTGGPGERADDGEDHHVWAGVLPLAVTAAAPLTSALTDAGVTPSAAVTRRAHRLGLDLGPEDVDR